MINSFVRSLISPLQKFCLFSSLLVIFTVPAIAQTAQIPGVLRWFPYFPQVNDNITIVYDATQGSAGLVGDSPVYAHTGLITTQSASDTVWFNVPDTWGTVDPNAQMTSLGNNKWTMSYNITSYYTVPGTDTVLKLGYVFRNATGSASGRNSDGSNIIIPIYGNFYHAGFINPHFEQMSLGDTMNILAAASLNSNISISVNGNLLATASGTDSLYVNSYHLINYGAYQFTMQATDSAGLTLGDTMLVLVNPPNNIQDPPDSLVDGINYIDDSTVVLILTAPLKSFVYVIGDFTNWQADTAFLMNQSNDGTRYWKQINGLTPGKEYIYQYLVDGWLYIGDPYADKVSDPNVDYTINPGVYPNLIKYPYGKTHNIATVLQTAQQPYDWKYDTFVRPNKMKMVVYELLVRDFVTRRSFAAVIDSLVYLKRLGINTVELMPIMNFESNNSWGYNPNYYFAVDKCYGPKDTLKKLIDTCHSMGIAVLLDIAMNDAFGTNPWVMMYWDTVRQRPLPNNPWFNVVAPHPYSVGYDFNHESSYTASFRTRATRYWLQQYHADGYRFDLTKGYTQFNSNATSNPVGVWGELDNSRVTTLESMVDSIWAVDSTALLVFEELADNDEQVLLANHGILLWGNDNCAYGQATMGYASGPCSWDISSVSYQAGQNSGWNKSENNLVSYMESHDEQRIMWDNETYGDSVPDYDIKDTITGLARIEAASVVFFPVPGPKMLWMFGELGYDVSSVLDGCNICEKPFLWNYETVPARAHLFNVFSQLIKLKLAYSPFWDNNYTIDFGNDVKCLKIYDSAFNVVTVANFSESQQTYTPHFLHTGTWYDFFTQDSLTVTSLQEVFGYQAGEYHLYTDKYIPLFKDSITSVTDTTGINAILNNSTNMVMAYPNPTYGPVNIMFTLQKASNVTLEIYDMDGRNIYTTQQTMMPGVQILNTDIDAANGMYFYRLTANGLAYNGKIGYIRK